ncbi:MAG: hypothetical protein IPP74_14750 [Alphaproteobacteria bacterium]|nr:hypothetical protein [Alphaproteobacteria bacterium]
MIDGTSNLQWMKPGPMAQEQMALIRAACLHLEEGLRKNLNPNRESSLALTKLEECCQWAIKSICVEDSKSHTLRPE